MAEDTTGLYAEHVATIKKRCDAALERGGHDFLAVYSGEEAIQFLDDNPYPFKVNPQFKAWVPLTRHPQCFLFYVPGKTPVLVYYKPVDYWHKPPDVPAGAWVEHYDVKVIGDPDEAKEFVPPGGRGAYVGEWHDRFSAWGLGEVNPRTVLDYLHFCRGAKTAYELACMREASRLGVLGHRAAAEAFHSGASEFEIDQAYRGAFGATQEEMPYGNIIALNENSAVLHYQHLGHERLPDAERRSFLIDAGAQYNGYASDITRTYTTGPGPFRDLIDALDTVQQDLCERVVAGTDYRDLHLDTHRKIADVLTNAGVLTCDAQTAVETGVTSTFFPHGLGHLLGLQVHDAGGFIGDDRGTEIPKPEGHPFLRLTRTLEPDMVVTIEPGIYFIDVLLAELKASPNAAHVDWDRVESFKPYGGIRIEDNVRAMQDGNENLTRAQFATLEHAG